jgi:hypothetical protein
VRVYTVCVCVCVRVYTVRSRSRPPRVLTDVRVRVGVGGWVAGWYTVLSSAFMCVYVLIHTYNAYACNTAHTHTHTHTQRAHTHIHICDNSIRKVVANFVTEGESKVREAEEKAGLGEDAVESLQDLEAEETPETMLISVLTGAVCICFIFFNIYISVLTGAVCIYTCITHDVYLYTPVYTAHMPCISL